MGEQSKITLREVPQQIPLNEIFENPQNPRKYFDEIGIRELADNIKAVGLLQPIRVRPVDGSFQIVHGHRRYSAIKMLGWETIPATVAQMSEKCQENIAYPTLVFLTEFTVTDDIFFYKNAHANINEFYDEHWTVFLSVDKDQKPSICKISERTCPNFDKRIDEFSQNEGE